MPWLNREEIREVSAQAQAIHDDILSGRLVIHAHAHDGHTIVAAGTYRGQSIHLHGENHLRQIALVYDTPTQALTEFEHLYGDAIRPGPAPATDIEQRTAQALAALTTGAATPTPDTLSGPAEPRTETVPVYAAEPGDHEALLNTFLDSQGEWEKYRTWSDDTTIANHETLTLRAEYVHDADPGDTNWTIAAYESPVGARLWHATATSTTPTELVRALLDTLASESAWGTRSSVSERTITEATRPLADAAWKQTIDGRRIRWTTPNGDAAGVQFDAFAAQARPDSPLPTWTLWGGNHVDRPTWAIRFSPHTPAAVLQDLTLELAHGTGTRQTVPHQAAVHISQITTTAPPAAPPHALPTSRQR